MKNIFLLDRLKKEAAAVGEKKNREKTVSEKAKSGLFYFFLFMLLFTVLSRSADSFTVAKVRAAEISQGSLSITANGEGVIEGKKETAIHTISDMKVKEVYVKTQDTVSKGTPLFLLDTEEIEDKISLLEDEKAKLQNELEQENYSETNAAELQQTGAEKNLEYAKLDLEMVKKEQDFAVQKALLDLEEANSKLILAEEKYQKKKEEKAEDILKEKKDAFQTAQKEYEDSKFSYETELTEAQRNIQDIKKEIDRIENRNTEGEVQAAINRYNSAVESGDRTEIDAAQENLNEVLYGSGGREEAKNELEDKNRELKRANEDYEAVLQKWELDIKIKEEKMEEAKKEWEAAENGTYPLEKELEEIQQQWDTAKETVKTMEEAYKEALNTQEISIEKGEREIEKANLDLEESMKIDENTKNNEENQAKLTNLRKESIQIDLEQKKKELTQYQKLKEAGGVVSSTVDGAVLAVNVEVGKKTTVESAVMITTKEEGYCFTGTIEEEKANYMAVGDNMKVTLKGKKSGINITISSVQFLPEEGKAKISGDLPEGTYVTGMGADFSYEKITDTYSYVIPLEALREDEKGYYVLIMEERESVLGKEMIAVKREVTLLEKDSRQAAIEGSFAAGEKIISASNKTIGEGDRVRSVSE